MEVHNERMMGNNGNNGNNFNENQMPSRTLAGRRYNQYNAYGGANNVPDALANNRNGNGNSNGNKVF